MKKRDALSIALMGLVVVIGFSGISSENRLLSCLACGNGVVDKKAGEGFSVEITFKNVGSTEDTWQVNIAFEGQQWIWKGTAQTLTLNAGSKKSLAWNGNVPSNAPEGSIARLIVYYDDFFVALDWWIQVITGAELTITSSTVK